MKKTLIALALTALPVAAMADVVLYGQIKGGVGVQVGNGDNDGTITQMEDYGSRIGFKGEEDLGNGLKAIWQVEQKVSLAGSQVSTGWNTRDTFIGLEGGFGKVRAGFVSDQFNENMEQTDIWEYSTNDTVGRVRGLGNLTRYDTRHQGVRYDSPDFGGFNFNITQAMADSAAENRYRYDNSTNGQAVDTFNPSKGAATIVGLNYENAGFFGSLGYGFYNHTTIDDSNDIANTHVARVEGGYNANNLFVGLAYQFVKDGVGFVDAGLAAPTVATETHEAAVSLAYTFGAITPKLSYAHGWNQKFQGEKVDNSGYDQVVIGADYALSKRTTALVSAGWLNGATSYDTDANGDMHGVDADQYSVGVGLRHKF